MIESMIRSNRHGESYRITPHEDGDSTIIQAVRSGKQITVNHTIDTINQAWYNWVMKGELIQVAFPFLTPDEREFLMTAITPEEWDRMFKREKEIG